MINKMDDMILNEQLRLCHDFLLDFELEQVRHKIFNFAIENLNATILDKKFHHFNNFKFAAKVDLTFALILYRREDGVFRSFYAQENKNLLDRYQLECTRLT